MVVKKTYNTVRILSIVATIVGVILLAVYVSLGRQFVPTLGHYKQQMLAEIESRFGVQIQLKQLTGTWDQFSPGVELIGFNMPNIQNPDLPGMDADELYGRISFFRSLWAGMPLLDDLVIKNANIHVYQHEGGNWEIAGISLGDSNSRQSSSPSAISVDDIFDAINHIEIENANVYFHSHKGSVVSLGSINLAIKQGLVSRKAKAIITSLEGKPLLEIDGVSKGSWGNSDFTIAAYAQVNDIELAPLLSLFDLDILGGSGIHGEAWFNWDGKKGGQLQGNLSSNNLRISSSEKYNAMRLLDAALHLVVEVDLQNNLSVWLHDSVFGWKQKEYVLPDAKFTRSANGDVSIGLAQTKVKPWLRFVNRVAKLSPKLQEVLTQLAPVGQLSNVNVTVAAGKPVSEALSFSADVDELHISPYGGAPGVENFAGHVSGTGLTGVVNVDTNNLSLWFPGVYQQKIPVHRLLGAVSWQVTDDDVVIDTDVLTVTGDFGAGNALLDLRFPKQRSEENYPYMSLQIGMRDFDVQYRNQVIPGIIGKDLMTWLEQGILAGKASEVGFMYYGSLLKDDNDRRVIQVEIDAQDAALQFAPDWPPAKDINTRVVVSDTVTRGYVKSATMFNSDLTNVKVDVIPENKIVQVAVVGDAVGPANDVVDLFTKTPLRDTFGSAFDSWQADGEYSAKIDFAMPVTAGATPVVNVTGELTDAGFIDTLVKLRFEDVNGDIQYSTSKGLSAKQLTASLWGEAVTATIETNAKKQIIIDANSKVAMSSVQQWLQQPVLGFAKGVTNMNARLQIAGESGGDTALKVKSTMQGVAIDLPSPLAKKKQAALPLTVAMALSQPGIPTEVVVTDLGKFSLMTAADSNKGGLVIIGAEQNAELPDTGIKITGKVDAVTLDEWLPVVDRYEEIAASMEQSGAVSSTEVVADSPVYIEDLQIDNFMAFNQVIKNITVGFRQKDLRWIAGFEHERLLGQALLPTADEKLGLEIEHIHLPLVVVENGAEEAATNDPGYDALADIDPSQYIPMVVSARSVHLDDLDLGSWDFNFQPTDYGAYVSGIKALVGGMNVTGFDAEQGADLFWQANGDVRQTVFQGILSAQDIGDVFIAQGVEPALVSESARFITNVSWPGSPAGLLIKNFDGDIQIDIREGQFLQSSATATGALKILGVLNFNNLIRRLQLDFSDLYKKGLSYKSVDGIMLFNDGIMTIEEPLHVKSLSSDFKMTGILDLEQQTIDGDLIATLPVSSNLPWIVALAGGLPAAAGTYIASLIFEDQINQLSSAVYTISGTWADPELKFEQLFDTKKSEKK